MLKARKLYIRSTLESIARPRARLRRSIVTLAIESSCDDTCVAILEKKDPSKDESRTPTLHVHHHEKATSNNLVFKGVHPLEALHSHQENLGKLVQKALSYLPVPSNTAKFHDENSLYVLGNGGTKRVTKPDFVAVTRGPGMRANLNVGLDFAKGLAVAWGRPLVGVNHMQAHALTPRLVTALSQTTIDQYIPEFPFLSLLISGGHTMLLHSESLNEHHELATTTDIAIGDAIDKIARDVLPTDILARSPSTMYGPTLEKFVFPNGDSDHDYDPPKTRGEELERYTDPHGWTLKPPMAGSKSGSRSRDMEFSFSGLHTSVSRIVKTLNETSEAIIENTQRRALAINAMRLAFEHLATRIKLALESLDSNRPTKAPPIDTLVVSGGVASNKYLRHILRAYLDKRGYSNIQLIFPPVHLCVDNAIMIGWAGIEMFEQGWHSNLSIRSLKKWSLDSKADDGGILGVNGWSRNQQYKGVSEFSP